MGVLSAKQVAALGLGAVGKDVTISDRCSIYGASAIAIRDHVRIDDYAVLTAREPVVIGSHVHVGAFAFLSGQFGIVLDDFVQVSPRATLLSGNDDFSGQWLAGPLVPPELRNVHGECIHLARWCMVGAHSVVLPGARFGEGAVVGALSLVKGPLEPWSIYGGVPVRFLAPRQRTVALLADRLVLG